MEEPGGPLWWLARLYAQISERRPEVKHYENYYSGDHKMAFATPKFREAFGTLFSEFADNWCELVVDAVEERLNVEGFRLGENTQGDKQAWAIWQDNNLDLSSQQAHTEALIHRSCYALVSPGEPVPRVTIEHPTQATVILDPADRTRRLAGLKCWTDDDGYEQATVYLPDWIYKFRSLSRSATDTGATTLILPFGAISSRWVMREQPGETWPLRNPLGTVSLVPLVNRPRLLNPGQSELQNVIPIQDGINKLVSDMLVASEFGAMPARWATGLETPIDPVTKLPVPAVVQAVNRFLLSPDSDARFGQLDGADLRNFVVAIELLVQHVASQTRTPPHYFFLGGAPPSGESIKSAETGLVAKTLRKTRSFGEGWEEVLRLCFALQGRSRRGMASMETIWRDVESRSESEHIDAITKKRAIGIPLQQLWEDAGYGPTQIARFTTMLAEEAKAGVAQGTFAERVTAVSELVRAGFDPAEALAAMGLDPIAHTGRLPVTVQAAPAETAAA